MFAYDRGGQHIDMTHWHFEINPLVSQAKITSLCFVWRISCVISSNFARQEAWQRSPLFQLALSRCPRFAGQCMASDVLRKMCWKTRFKFLYVSSKPFPAPINIFRGAVEILAESHVKILRCKWTLKYLDRFSRYPSLSNLIKIGLYIV
jgi:hypothetical protein